MATDTLDPNSTVAHTWSGGAGHTNIDDGVRQPTIGDTSVISALFANGDDNDVEIVGFPNTIIDVGEVTNITVWTFGGAFQYPEVSIDMGGVQTYQECVLGVGPNYLWESNSFNGNWSQADLDGLEVLYRADTPDPGKGPGGNWIDACYVVVTYTEAGVDYLLSDPLGVDIVAGVKSVMGVAYANIKSIKGVA